MSQPQSQPQSQTHPLSPPQPPSPEAPTKETSKECAKTLDPLMAEVAALIVEGLNLEVNPTEVDPDAPLYGAGLGLDSIDMLEIALLISKQYGFQLKSDLDNKEEIFSSLRSLTQHIASQRVE